ARPGFRHRRGMRRKLVMEDGEREVLMSHTRRSSRFFALVRAGALKPGSWLISLRSVAQLAQEFIYPHQGLPEHPLTSPNFHIRFRISRSVTTLGGCVDGRDIIEIAVGIAQHNAVTYRASIFPVNLKIHERFAGHSEYGNLLVQQKARDVKIQMIRRGIMNE